MLHRARLLTAFAVLVTAVAVRMLGTTLGETTPGNDAAAQASSAPPSTNPTEGPPVDPGAVRHNQPVLEALSQNWTQIPDVLDAHVGYEATSGTVVGYAVCNHCDLTALERRLTGTVWVSDLWSVDAIRISVAHDTDRNRARVRTWQLPREAPVLVDRYGSGSVTVGRGPGAAAASAPPKQSATQSPAQSPAQPPTQTPNPPSSDAALVASPAHPASVDSGL